MTHINELLNKGRCWCACFCFFLGFHAHAQTNLVPNPSFEQIYNNYDLDSWAATGSMVIQKIWMAEGWNAVCACPNVWFAQGDSNTADYFNSGVSSTFVDFPKKFRFPHTGSAMVSVIYSATDFDDGTRYNESFGCDLILPTVPGVFYKAGFWTLRHIYMDKETGVISHLRAATNQYGITLSTWQVHHNHYKINPGKVVLAMPKPVCDENWKLYEADFKADSAYTKLMVATVREDKDLGFCNRIDSLEFKSQFTWFDTVSGGWISPHNYARYFFDDIYLMPVMNGNYIAAPAAVCANDSFTIYAPLDNSNIVWIDEDSKAVLGVGPVLRLAIAQNIRIRATGNNWTDVISIGIELQPTDPFTTDSLVYCASDSVLLDAQNPGASYLWENGSTDKLRTVRDSGDKWVLVTNTKGCKASFGVHIQKDLLPVYTYPADTTICLPGAYGFITQSSIGNWQWEDGHPTGLRSISTPGVYAYKVVNGKCTETDTVEVKGIAYPQQTNWKDTVVCAGSQIVLTAPAAEKLLWNNGDITTTVVRNQSGTYSYRAWNGHCEVGDTMELKVQTPPEFYVLQTDTFCPGRNGNINLELRPVGMAGTWYPGGIYGSNYAVTKQESIRVVLKDMYGCTSEKTVDPVGNCTFLVFVADAFTPDGNGLNDYFEPYTENATDVELTMRNRWGQILYRGSPARWDGNYMGAPCPEGIYTWQIRANGPDANGRIYPIHISGNVSLLR